MIIFIFVDNFSTDGSSEYLSQRKDVNITIYFTHQSYKNSYYGVEWINFLLDKYCKDKWCIVVDVDEILYIREDNIQMLINKMEKENYNLTYNLLLDMYPKKNNGENYESGNKFLKHSNYYDMYSGKYNRLNKKSKYIFQLFGGNEKKNF